MRLGSRAFLAVVLVSGALIAVLYTAPQFIIGYLGMPRRFHALPGKLQVVYDHAMPPNTIPLSQMMRELSAQPGFTEAFLAQIQGGPKKSGTALLTPDLVDHLRNLIVGKDWSGLDRFPGWTMGQISPTVGALSHVMNPGKVPLPKFLDTGSFALDTGGTIADFRQPAPPSAPTPIVDLGYSITKGDVQTGTQTEHNESQRLADVLNRLAANGLDGVPVANVFWNNERMPSTPEELIDDLIQTGHTVTVTDSRYVANFGQMHYRGHDVMMPFFLNSQILVPGTNRPLLIPASHAEYEWHIRGPLLNAELSFFFAIDGKAEFRTNDTRNQTWVMGRDAHTYTGADAVEVTRLSAAVVRKYMRLHRAHPAVPFEGYYAFGVCQDVVAAIELKMTGRATLFPNTADDRFFSGPDADPRDAEIDSLILRLPKDRAGKPPAVERIFASLPIGSSDADLAAVTIPGLGADLVAVHDAWQAGTLKRTQSPWIRRLEYAAVVLAIIASLVYGFTRRRRS